MQFSVLAAITLSVSVATTTAMPWAQVARDLVKDVNFVARQESPLPTTSSPVDTAAQSPLPTSSPVDTAAQSPLPTSSPVDTAAQSPLPTSSPVDTAAQSPLPTSSPVDTAAQSPLPTTSSPVDTTVTDSPSPTQTL